MPLHRPRPGARTTTRSRRRCALNSQPRGEKTGRRHPSNATKVPRGVLPQAADGTPQTVYCHEGVGTGGGPDKFIGGALGEGIAANIGRRIGSFMRAGGSHLHRSGTCAMC